MPCCNGLLFVTDVERELQKLQDVNAQRLDDLRRVNPEAYQVVTWLRKNKEQFRGVIHEPMILSVSIFIVLTYCSECDSE